ncbi:RnfABCDGE type electron transport complex subunit G [Bacteroidota bacterium]
MAKKESTFFNMVLVLFLVTLIASTSLGIIYSITKEPIEKAKIAIKITAINEVVPTFNNIPLNESSSVKLDKDSLIIYPATYDGKIVGTAIESFTNKGFSGKIRLMIGFLPDGSINNITVLEHKETPGLGDKMEKKKSDFSKQFIGKNPKSFKLKVTKDGGDVDAITAATISSRAFCDAIQNAYSTYLSLENELIKIDTTQVEN